MRPLSLLSLFRLFRRSVRAAPWTRLSDRTKVGGLALTSLTTNELPLLTLVGEFVFLALVAYTTFLLAKPVLSTLYPDLADDIGARLILTLPAVGLVHGVSWSMDSGVPSVHEASVAVAVFATPVLLDVYLSRTDTSRAYPFAYSFRLHRVFDTSREKLAVNRQRIEVVNENTVVPYKALFSYELRALIALTLTAPFYMWSGLLVVFEGFYPALELALLVGAAFGPAIARRTPRFDDESEVLAAIDTEEQSTRAFMTRGTFHPKWLTSVGFIALNIALTMGLFFGGASLLYVVFTHVETFSQSQSTDALLRVAALVAYTSTCFVFSLYALWFWRVELARLPAFFSYWRSAYGQTDTESPSPATETPAKTRPPWGLLPPATLLILIALTLGLGQTVQSNATAIRLVFGVFVALWALGLLFVGWAVVQWHRRDPQPIQNESRALVGNCIVQTIALASITVPVSGLYNTALGFFVLTTGALILLFYLIDLIEILENKYGEQSLLQWSPALGVIAMFVIGRHLRSGAQTQFTIFIIGTSGVFLFLLTLMQAQRWLANKHAPLEEFQPDDTPASTETDEHTASE